MPVFVFIPIHPRRIYCIHRIIPAIGIGAEVVVFLAHGIHGGEAHETGIVMAGTVVWRGAAEGDVAVIYQNLLQCPVLVYHIAAIVCCTARTAIGHVELLARCIVGVADGTAR